MAGAVQARLASHPFAHSQHEGDLIVKERAAGTAADLAFAKRHPARHAQPRAAQKKGGRSPRIHSSPRSANDSDRVPATTIWSSTRTSTSASPDLSVCVSASSARDGSGCPLGWLWLRITAPAL